MPAFGQLIGPIRCSSSETTTGRPSFCLGRSRFLWDFRGRRCQYIRRSCTNSRSWHPRWGLLRWRRHGINDDAVLGRYLVAAGALRLGIKFIRANTRVVWSLSVAYLVSPAIIAVDIGMLALSRCDAPAAYSRRTAR